MVTKAVLARDIADPCKEAVADSILNNLSARVSGKGDFHRFISNARPSDLLVSGFIVPCPKKEGESDEEANPLQINAHGLDFHVSDASLARPIKLRLGGSVYLRVFPSVSDIAPGGELTPEIRRNSEIDRGLKTRTYAAMDALRAELGVERFKESSHPDWGKRLGALRRQLHAEMGIPFDATDSSDTTPIPDPNESGADGDEPVDETPKGASGNRKYGADNLYQPTEPPQKWLRLDLDLPTVATPLSACTVEHLEELNAQLNAAIADQIGKWLETSGRRPDSEHVAYKSGTKVLPSHLSDWKAFLRAACESSRPFAIPTFDIRWAISAVPDPLKSGRSLVHVAVENWSPLPSEKGRLKELELCLFQVQVTVEMPASGLQPLLLDRVKPSYRYNAYLDYPALGFNCGVTSHRDPDRDILATTWNPRYTLPRIIPSAVDAERNFAELAKKDGVDKLAPLVPGFLKWIEQTSKNTQVAAGISGPNSAEMLEREKGEFAKDLRYWEKECAGIARGIRLLKESSEHWNGPGVQADPMGRPFEAWLTMNAAMGEVGKGKYDSWRLFQVAFIVSMIPAFATRMPGFDHFYKEEGAEQQINAVTLLYFATGGGKSEAFLGLLLFVLVLDRLRGKERGVSSLMRYPLRLLTLQQARRTMRVLAAGEVQRGHRKHPGEPLSLGFWVGSSNTPNWRSDREIADVPTLDKMPAESESEMASVEAYARRKSAWLKLESCPFCGSRTALRRAPKREGGILGHYCIAPLASCDWGKRHPVRRALPFYIVDEDIYAIAPSVLLGTVDKLAVIGQSFKTIRKVFGMFGMAPYREPSTGHLRTPISRSDWASASAENLEQLFPAFSTGKRAFFDPFPSLLIQDEAHLLEESLGTFAGLFESALDAGLDKLAPLLGSEISADPIKGERRRIKVIAASATVSEPERQMRNLYQRDSTIQFPYPGPSLYSSFYANPKADPARSALKDPERSANAARIYAAIVTNGHRHTVSVSSILGQYHLLITKLYEDLRVGGDEGEQRARAVLVNWISEGQLRPYLLQALHAASREALLTLVDLHRIALTYVTNKKGGDQVIDTERSEFDDVHQAEGFLNEVLNTRLISGAVSASEIQDVVGMAEDRVKPGHEFPPLSETLRSIIATSAVSHGVDVEEFNAMFFAGLPSDIAEYIQASSRVGRMHVGFSLLIPVPQRARDRFVVEIFDIFHRFLERMVLPAAIDRWADKAIRRVIPSVMQEYLCGVSRFVEIAAVPPSQKGTVSDMRNTSDAHAFLNEPVNREALASFLIVALGLATKPEVEAWQFYKAMVTREISEYRQAMTDTALGASSLREFFSRRNAELRPMTSLRDVDLQGVISEGWTDARGNRVQAGMTAVAMNFIRRGIVGELDEEDDDDSE
jgi:hypothetical protein